MIRADSEYRTGSSVTTSRGMGETEDFIKQLANLALPSPMFTLPVPSEEVSMKPIVINDSDIKSIKPSINPSELLVSNSLGSKWETRVTTEAAGFISIVIKGFDTREELALADVQISSKVLMIAMGPLGRLEVTSPVDLDASSVEAKTSLKKGTLTVKLHIR
jgi:hypothetical protein